MTGLSPRPTREQVDAALARADRVHVGGSNEVRQAVHVLAAEVRALRAERDAALALHQDAGGGMGYDGTGKYVDFSTACGICGTSDEYAVAWPCDTARTLGVES